MGLDTTHDAWHGPYSAFMEWRIWLAKQIEINLLDMEGFSERDYLNPDRKKGTIKWNTVDDDLKFLLNHSDCDGHLTPTKCKKIAERLKSIIGDREIPEKSLFNSKDDWYLIKTYNFMKGCLNAYENKENLEFH